MLKVQSWQWMSLWSSNTESNGLDNNGLFMNLLPRKLPRDRATAFSKLTKLSPEATAATVYPGLPQPSSLKPGVFSSQSGAERGRGERLPGCLHPDR